MRNLLILLLTLPAIFSGCDSAKKQQPKDDNYPLIVAHRGFYKTEGSEENTISSLSNAQKLSVYGVEFDVQMTSEDSLVIFHDNTDKETGTKIQSGNFEEIRKLVLKNGHQIPTFREWLTQGKKDPDTKLILEIKKHDTPERETQLVEAIVKLINEFNMMDQMELISFSKHACEECIRLVPDATVVFVSSRVDLSPAELNTKGYKGLSYKVNVLQEKPEWIKEANDLGLASTLWMVNDNELIDWAIEHHVTYISTDHPDQAKAYLKSLKDNKQAGSNL
ncbi:glycerophosphodiester phosphodiesterase family protein [Maribellus sp. YY47]|uniref:glycerophosphodiester phosphodiesterase n=1 Tax=Maribellus sp. YY47 TaxID=2929486 RepID=UPI0020017615|nr:glycerophosphodiester phosphodiesterase family protein [Maribellus sp. YY47]MCK3686298.1 hypothetical protein [Maribellus sp. YY47]